MNLKNLGLILMIISIIFLLAPFTNGFIPIQYNLFITPLFLLVNTFRLGNYGLLAYAILGFTLLYYSMDLYKRS